MYFNEGDRAAYRSLHGGLIFQAVAYRQSDLHIGAPEACAERVWARAREALPMIRKPLDAYAEAHPEFVGTLEPYPDSPDMPPIAREMRRVTAIIGVGPMAAVAGAVAARAGVSLASARRRVSACAGRRGRPGRAAGYGSG